MSYEACDDGNLIDGDGCNSTCMVEENWSCSGGSPTNKDTCGCSNDTSVSEFGTTCIKLDVAIQETIAQASSYAVTVAGSTENGLIGAQLISGASGSIFATALNSLHLLMLFKYCDVGYPPNVEQFFIILSGNSSSSSPSSTNILNIFTKLGDQYSLINDTQNRFEKFGTKSFFLSNIGSLVFTILIVLFVIVFLNILNKLIKNNTAKRVISTTLLPIFQWNMLLNSIIGAQTKLALAWFLQFNHPFGNEYSIVNFAIALTSLVTILAMYLTSIYQISWNWNIIKEKLFLSRQVLAKALIKQNQWGILWKSYDIKASIGRYFVILQIIRNTLHVTFICTLSNHPIVQCFSLLVLSILYLVVMGIGRPFRKIIDTLNAISNEICILLEEILMTIFVFNKNNFFLALSTGNTLGWAMIGIIFLSLGLNVLCIIGSLIAGIINGIKERKKKKMQLERKERLERVEAISHLEKTRIDLYQTRVQGPNDTTIQESKKIIPEQNEALDLLISLKPINKRRRLH